MMLKNNGKVLLSSITSRLAPSFFCSIFLLFSISTYGQQINGCIKDADTGEAIPFVSVYFSGTSIGTAAGEDGCFSIAQRLEVLAPLVFSVLGYQKLTINDPLQVDVSLIKLKPAIDALDAVYLNPDPWTRAQKERWFKKLFLGDIPEAALCTIKNLQDIRLQFNPVTNMLIAVADAPILVKNEHLGYLIRYDLLEFEALFNEKDFDGTISINGEKLNGKVYSNKSSYIAGSVFFQELDEKKPKTRIWAKRRKAMYKQSVIRCFRALLQKQFDKEGYYLFYNSFRVDTQQHIRVRKINDMYTMSFRHEKYSILDSQENQSTLVLNQQQIDFDAYGNNLSPRSIQFIGHMAKLQIAGMLPLEYGLEKL